MSLRDNGKLECTAVEREEPFDEEDIRLDVVLAQVLDDVWMLLSEEEVEYVHVQANLLDLELVQVRKELIPCNQVVQVFER